MESDNNNRMQFRDADLNEQPAELSPKKIKPIQKFFRRTFVVVVLFSILTAYLTQHIYVMNVSYKSQSIEKRLKELRKENQLLQIKLARHESLESIDRIAQSKLGMVRPSKVEYLIVRDINEH